MTAQSRRNVFLIASYNRTTRAGRRRQDALLYVYPGDNVILKLEPHSDPDGNRVVVLVGNQDIGYLANEIADII